MENTIDHIDDLIGKVLAGEATEADKDFVSKWIGQSEANRKYFDQMRTIFESAASSAVRVQFDTDVAWRKVKSRLKEEPRKAGQWFTSWKLAASILIVVAVGYIIWETARPDVELQSVASGTQTLADTLPDGSMAFLNKKSEVQFEYNSRKKVRKVTLKGEAFFTVKHEEEKPFIIETNDVLIRDIGTAFNVKAFPENQTVEVLVEEGEVQFYTLLDSGLNLRAGEKGVYDKILKKFSMITRIDTNSLSYKTKVFSFNNTDLATVVAKLNEVYGSEILLASPTLGDCHLTVNFNDDKLDTILEVLAETLTLTVVRNGEQIILNGKGCN